MQVLHLTYSAAFVIALAAQFSTLANLYAAAGN